MFQKQEARTAFKSVTIKNRTKKPFIHEYDGNRIVIGSMKQLTLPYAVAKDCAYHLAQRVLDEKGIPFFGQEHDDEIARLMGEEVVKEELIEDDGDIIEGEDIGEDIVDEVEEVVAPVKKVGRKPKKEESKEESEEVEEVMEPVEGNEEE